MTKLMHLADIARLDDPDARLDAELEHLDDLIRVAKLRRRQYNGESVPDPDGNSVTRALELAHRLTLEAAERRGTDRPGAQQKTRAEAIAELKAVLEVWEDPQVTDEQWQSMRNARVTAKPRPLTTARTRKLRPTGLR